MDDYESILTDENINPQLKGEIKSLNKRANRLINKIENILRNVRGNNFYEPAKLNIALNNIEEYFEQLREVYEQENRILSGLLKRAYRIESDINIKDEKIKSKGGEKEPKEYGDNIINRTYRYYNRALPKLNNFHSKNRK